MGPNIEELLLDVAPNIFTFSFQPTPKPLPKKRQHIPPLHSNHTKELLPDIALNTSSSSSQPNLKPLPKKQQRNHLLHSDRPTQLLDKTIQVVEREKEIKAWAEDKLLRQKQKD